MDPEQSINRITSELICSSSSCCVMSGWNEKQATALSPAFSPTAVGLQRSIFSRQKHVCTGKLRENSRKITCENQWFGSVKRVIRRFWWRVTPFYRLQRGPGDLSHPSGGSKSLSEQRTGSTTSQKFWRENLEKIHGEFWRENSVQKYHLVSTADFCVVSWQREINLAISIIKSVYVCDHDLYLFFRR